MCGIVGIHPENKSAVEAMLTTIQHRGHDAQNIQTVHSTSVGHVLHALVGTVPQPITATGTLLFNGEIYNWEDLNMQEECGAQNDTELLLHLLDTYGPEKTRAKLDGVYAYAYITDDSITIERDLLGVKPLWYAHENGTFAFASEQKALLQQGLLAKELHPRTTLTYNKTTQELSSVVRPFTFETQYDSLYSVMNEAVIKRLPKNKKIGILFSGGIDSALLATMAKDQQADITLYVASLNDPEKADPHDLLAARQAAQELGLPLVEVHATLQETQALIPHVARAIESANPVKVGVALPFWLCCVQAQRDGQRILFSGLGAEEVFAGYQRHKHARNINQECLRGLRAMHERDLYRDDVVGMTHTLEIRLPFLDHDVIALGLEMPGEKKIVDGLGKMPLRELAKQVGLSEEIAMRPKKAAQYGSQFDAAIEKLARNQGMKKGAYLRTIYPAHVKLCALLSSGKDSVYAIHVMQKMNYDIACTATIISKNPDSYMYHTPVANLAEKQSESMGISWLSIETEGVKEQELDALRNILKQAIENYHIKGVVSGALYSNYQRERIEQVCEELGLRIYAPLWHLDQEQEVREILDAGFTFVLSKVAAEGLDASFVGRPITHEDIDHFRDHLHLNVAGEGGEYESLVIDGPNFSEPLDISSLKTATSQEGSVQVAQLE